jgi:YaiO family outer membrane protein
VRAIREAAGAILTLILALALAPPAAAQEIRGPSATSETDTPAPRPETGPAGSKITGFIETGVNYYLLNGAQKNWFGQYLRGVVDVAQKNIWNYEVVHEQEFGDAGTFFSLGYTHAFDAEWHSTVSMGSSAGGFFWPQFRVDAFLSRKWLEKRNLVTTIGFGYYDAKDLHHDLNLFIGATYYFESPWIVEAGLHYNISQPGSVTAPGPFAAVTYGRNKEHYLVLRVGIGREAYQVVGPDVAITDFASQVVTLTWRQWLTREWGFRLLTEYYHNPTYERVGFEIGIFRDF